MAGVETLVTDHLDLWAAALKHRSTAGRGSSSKVELYGIKKLRELILELALHGLLVPQDPNDEPASEQLKKIAAEKAKLAKEGKIKKENLFPAVAEDEKPYSLPEGWQWCRLGDIGSIFNGNSVNASVKEDRYTNVDGLPFIATKDVGYGFENLDYQNGIFIPLDEPGFKIAREGAVLICAEGGSAGKKCGITSQDICFGNKLFANELHGDINSKFILSAYLTPTFSAQFSSAMTGIIGGISSAKFSALLVPIAPVQEQHRIVAKVDALMALCDQLEHQTAASLSAHRTLVETLLNALTSAADYTQFASAWQRIAEHFDSLFNTEESVDQLKQTILRLAVMGKLVQQDPQDEPASELLKKISAEKAKLVKEGKIKKEKPLPPIADNEKPFALPIGWEFCRLQEAIDVRDGTHDSPKDAIGVNTYPLVTSKNFISGGIDFDGARRISEEDHLEISKRSFVEVDDILFSMIGGNIGNQVMVRDPRPFSVKNVALFKYILKSATNPRFFYLYTQELAAELQQKASGGAQPFVSLGFLRNLVFALPPIAEQHRLVAKVDELIALCDQLKARLSDAQTAQLYLAETMTEKALA
jgi:type I restriction enzyme S subunit